MYILFKHFQSDCESKKNLVASNSITNKNKIQSTSSKNSNFPIPNNASSVTAISLPAYAMLSFRKREELTKRASSNSFETAELQSNLNNRQKSEA